MSSSKPKLEMTGAKLWYLPCCSAMGFMGAVGGVRDGHGGAVPEYGVAIEPAQGVGGRRPGDVHRVVGGPDARRMAGGGEGRGGGRGGAVLGPDMEVVPVAVCPRRAPEQPFHSLYVSRLIGDRLRNNNPEHGVAIE